MYSGTLCNRMGNSVFNSDLVEWLFWYLGAWAEVGGVAVKRLFLLTKFCLQEWSDRRSLCGTDRLLQCHAGQSAALQV